MTDAGEIVATSRRKRGFSQARLAAAMGTTQSAVARLEAPRANPTVKTIERALAATGHELRLSAVPRTADLDESQIVELLRLTPTERLARFTSSYRNMRRLLGAVARSSQ